MKYRIVYAFPEGYHIESSRLGLFWKPCVFNKKKNMVIPCIETAKEYVERLKIKGKEVVNE